VGQERYVEYLNDIRGSGAHLLEIINDILDIAKVEAGRLDLNEDLVDIGATITTCVKLLRHRADDAGVTLGTRIGEGIGNIWADSRKFKQILVNLLSNAVKFTPEGGHAIVEVDIGENGDLVLSVTDNGPGIPSECLEEVMNPFVQIDSGLNRKYEGTGLGLPLCKALIEAHGGRFELESTPGEGTVAIVHFPSDRLRKAHSGAAGSKAARLP
jgi:signal transduction histidine kinase